ncbi:MAG TPA: hypothetical protein VI408_01490, partial [Gaiellaceae bacterium]
MQRLLYAVPAVLALVLAAASIGAADTSQPFLLVLAKGPDPGSTTPSGADALAEVAQAGATTLKIGPATVPWTDGDITAANSADRAALAHGLGTWVNLSTVARATPTSGDTLLAQVVNSLKADAGAPAIALWKGADEPQWSGFAPSSLEFAYCRATGRGQTSWCAGEPVLDTSHPFVTIEAPKNADQLQPYSAVTDV